MSVVSVCWLQGCVHSMVTEATFPQNHTRFLHFLFPKVEEHKTMRAFGHAELNLNKEEFQWLVSLTNGTCCSHGHVCPYVFHTTQGKQILKPVHFIQLAWADCGMTGSINFNKIRSSVSTQVRNVYRLGTGHRIQLECSIFTLILHVCTEE